MMNATQDARTADGRTVRLRTVTVGQAFGTICQVVARNGRVVAETNPPRPHGAIEAALADGRDMAARLGRVNAK